MLYLCYFRRLVVYSRNCPNEESFNLLGWRDAILLDLDDTCYKPISSFQQLFFSFNINNEFDINITKSNFKSNPNPSIKLILVF